MPVRSIHFLVLLTALLFCACQTTLPPPRPLANMYPSLEPAAVLNALQPRPTDPDWLRRQLAAIALDRLLLQYGFPDHEWPLLARGLSRRGYAEIDARKTGSPLRWMIFRAPSGNPQLMIIAAFDNLPHPTVLAGLQPDRTPPDRASVTAEFLVREWQTRLDNGALLILRSLAPVRSGAPQRWQIILLITDALEGNEHHETAH